MKISILIHSLAGGGAERVVSQLVTYLHQSGVKVYLVLLSDIIVYEIPEDIEIHYLEKTNLKDSGLSKLLKLPLLAYRYKNFLIKNDIAISLSFLNRPNYINIVAKLLGAKVKTYISERSNPSAQYIGKSLHCRINTFIIKKIFPHADGIITNSSGNGLELIKNFNIPKKLISTIYNPIDLEKVTNEHEIEGFYDKKYFNFITVGRLNEGKNHILLLNSFHFIENKNIRLYIFGEGELKKFLQEKIEELNLQDFVFLMDFSKNIFSYLKGADAFLFGSNHEGFPNVLIEAMACGLPIISTDCTSGPREIMKAAIPDNNTKSIKTDYGFILPLNNIKEMTRSIDELVADFQYYELCKKNVLVRAYDFRRNYILEQYFEYIK